MNRGFYPSDEYVLVDIKKCFDGEKESMVNLSFKGREIDPHPSEKDIKNRSDGYKSHGKIGGILLYW